MQIQNHNTGYVRDALFIASDEGLHSSLSPEKGLDVCIELKYQFLNVTSAIGVEGPTLF